jgi:hypothetical protein
MTKNIRKSLTITGVLMLFVLVVAACQPMSASQEGAGLELNETWVNLKSDYPYEQVYLEKQKALEAAEESGIEEMSEMKAAIIPGIAIQELRLTSGPVNINSEIVPQSIVLSAELSGASMTVQEVTSTGPGWVVFHKDENGEPGEILGYVAVEGGSSLDVAIDVPAEFSSETIHAMLHVDQGILGQMEWPRGPDTPVYVGGEIVNKPMAAVIE